MKTISKGMRRAAFVCFFAVCCQLSASEARAQMVSIVATDTQVAEPGAFTPADPGSFTISRTGSTEWPLAVKLIFPGMAKNGVDFAEVPSTVTIPAGASSVVLTIQPLWDNWQETQENAVLRVADNAGVYVVSPSQYAAVVQIQDSGEGTGGPEPVIVNRPTVSIVVVDAEASERMADGATNTARLLISRTGSTENSLNVRFELLGSAKNGVDYATFSPASVILLKDQSSREIVIRPTRDDLLEPTETVLVKLIDNGLSYTIDAVNSQGQVTIVDDTAEETSPPPPVVSVVATDGEAKETPAGAMANTGRFVISRTGSTDEAINVFVVYQGTAEAGVDYATLSANVVIPAGAASQELLVRPLYDKMGEATESVRLCLGDRPTGRYTLDAAKSWALVNILDAEPPPPSGSPVVSIRVDDGDATEPPVAGFTNVAEITFSRTGSLDAPLTVNFVIEGSAINGVDYANLPTSATFRAGNSYTRLSIEPRHDNLIEPTESLILRLTNSPAGGYSVDPVAHYGVVTIADNGLGTVQPTPEPPYVSIRVLDAEAAEIPATGEANPARFLVTRTGGVHTALEVRLATGGTATYGEDYSAFDSLTVTIPYGRASTEVLVRPIHDFLEEPSETVTLAVVANGTAYGIDPVRCVAQVTILNDNGAVAPPTGPLVRIQAVDSDAAETEDGEAANSAEFKITRTDPAVVLSVRLLVGGRAVNGVDYEAVAEYVTFAVGEAEKSIFIRPINDAIIEGGETVVIALTNANSGPVYSINTGMGRAEVMIADNDFYPRVSVAATDAQAAEPTGNGELNVGRFTFTRTGKTTSPLTVKYHLGGTATEGADYESLSSKTVVIPAGQTSADVVIRPVNDQVVEAAETVVVHVDFAAADYQLDFVDGIATVTIADSGESAPPPVVSIEAIDTEAAEAVSGGVTNTAEFMIARSGGTVTALAVKLLFEGTATSGADYAVPSTTVVIPAGEVAVAVTIRPRNDTLVESTETVTVRISSELATYTVAEQFGSAQAVILDDDAPAPPAEPVVGVTTLSAYATEQYPIVGTFRIAREGNLEEALEVAFTVTGSATPDDDYLRLPNSVTIPAGEAYADVNVVALDDTLAEGFESIIVTLNKAPVSGANGSAIVYILDRIEYPPLPFSAAVQSAAAAVGENGLTIDRLGQVTLTSNDGALEVVEFSTDLVKWQPLGYGFVSGRKLRLEDEAAPAAQMRFYRSVLVRPAPSQ